MKVVSGVILMIRQRNVQDRTGATYGDDKDCTLSAGNTFDGTIWTIRVSDQGSFAKSELD